jgi:hypothetical protein
MWLRGAWYTAANGGFDGRWVQLFDDRPSYEAAPPLYAIGLKGKGRRLFEAAAAL